MEKGICNFPLIACRKEANERSEMVTQLLYGESYSVISRNDQWVNIKADRDEYESWIDLKLHSPLIDKGNTLYPVHETFTSIVGEDSHELIVPGGSLTILNKTVKNETSLIDTALGYLSAPYLWGGKSIWGIDCSGFVQVVFQIHGINISRDAYQQAELGEAIEFNELIEAGDLAFFSKENEKITHVGICLGDEKIIHASGKVRIDKLDHNGIYNVDTQKYSHDLRIIKRIKKAANS